MAYRFLAYPTGVEFTLDLRLRRPEDYQRDMPWDLHGRRRPGPPPDDFLRLGMLLSDGAKWTNLEWRHWRADEPPQPPVVMHRGGGGGGDSFTMRYWMWPLPPAGPLTLVSQWPAYEVPETTVVVDTTELLARASESQPIWPE